MTTPEEIFAQAFKELVREVLREELGARSDTQDIELLTAGQVAKMLGLKNRHAVYNLKREGKLKAIYIGEKTYRFPREEVQRFIRDSRQKTDMSED